jgi:hypothetical protein
MNGSPNMAALMKSLGGAGKTSGQPFDVSGMRGGVGGGRGVPANFLPSSAITLPYSLSTGGAQSLLQQILNQNKLNPTG